MKNKKSTTDNIKLKEEKIKKKVDLRLYRKEAKATSMQSSSKESRNWLKSSYPLGNAKKCWIYAC